MSRTQNSLKNVKYGSIAYGAKVLAAFFLRMVFVSVLSSEYMGIEGVFTTMLYVISLAGLGYETAVSYALYKPIAENDYGRIRSIMAMYRKTSIFITLSIAGIGLLLLPLLNIFILDIPNIADIELLYLLFVVNTAVGYLFYYNKVLITAYQKQYIVVTTHYLLGMVMDLTQAALLLLTRSYLACMLSQIVFSLLENGLLAWKVRRLYGFLFSGEPGLERESVRPSILRYVHSALFHKAGEAILTYADTILISSCVGILAAGLYSNYKFITYALNSVFILLLNGVAASIGNLGASGAQNRSREVFFAYNFVAAWLYGLSSICLFLLFNPFIKLWLGTDYLLPDGVVAAISLHFYLSGMKKPVLVYRDVLGLFSFDRYVPVAEVALYIGLSIWLASSLGIVGVMFAGILAQLLTSFWAEPRVVFQRGFSGQAGAYFGKYTLYAVITVGAGGGVYLLCGMVVAGGALGLLFRACIAVLLPNLLFTAAYWNTPEFMTLRHAIRDIWKKKRENRD